MTHYIEQTNLFKRQVKLAQKRGKNIDKLKIAIQHLSQDKLLATEYRLTDDGGLELVETGTHADLFN